MPLVVLFPSTSKHNPFAFDDILKNKRFQIVLVPFVGPNGRHSLDIKTVAQKYGVKIAENWHEAYHQCHSDMIIFTGSLYFVSEVRGEICQN